MIDPSRRDLLLAPLLVALVSDGDAEAAALDPGMTIVRQFGDIPWGGVVME